MFGFIVGIALGAILVPQPVWAATARVAVWTWLRSLVAERT